MIDSNRSFLRIENPRSAAQRAGVTVQDGITAGPNGVELDTLVSDTNITQGETAVNSESQGDDGLGAANAGFDPVSPRHKSYTKRDCVNSPFFIDAVSETEA